MGTGCRRVAARCSACPGDERGGGQRQDAGAGADDGERVDRPRSVGVRDRQPESDRVLRGPVDAERVRTEGCKQAPGGHGQRARRELGSGDRSRQADAHRQRQGEGEHGEHRQPCEPGPVHARDRERGRLELAVAEALGPDARERVGAHGRARHGRDQHRHDRDAGEPQRRSWETGDGRRQPKPEERDGEDQKARPGDGASEREVVARVVREQDERDAGNGERLRSPPAPVQEQDADGRQRQDRREREQSPRTEQELHGGAGVGHVDSEEAALVLLEPRIGDPRERAEGHLVVDQQGQHPGQPAEHVGHEPAQRGSQVPHARQRVGGQDDGDQSRGILGRHGGAGEQPGPSQRERARLARAQTRMEEKRKRGEDQRRGEDVSEQRRGVREQQRPATDGHGGERAEPRLDPLGDRPHRQQQDQPGQDRTPEAEQPDRPVVLMGPDRHHGAARQPGQVQHLVCRLRPVGQPGCAVGVPVPVDLDLVVGLGVVDVVVDEDGAVRERLDQRVVGSLVPADLLDRRRVNQSDGEDRQESGCPEAQLV